MSAATDSAKGEAPAAEKARLTPAAEAEERCRSLLSDDRNAPKLQVATGNLDKQQCPLWTQLLHNEGWMQRVGSNPTCTEGTTLEDIYKWGQTFYVHHPMASVLVLAAVQQCSVTGSLAMDIGAYIAWVATDALLVAADAVADLCSDRAPLPSAISDLERHAESPAAALKCN